MDEISLLRRARTDVPERAPERVAEGRAALFAQIDAEAPYAPYTAVGDETSFAPMPAPAHRRRGRSAGWMKLSVLGVGVLTIALIGGILLGFGSWRGGADSAAAAVLNAAAIATLEATDPQLAPGQYLRVRNDAVYVTQTWLQEDVDAARVNGVADLSTVQAQYYLRREQMEMFQPADRNDTWWLLQCRGSVAQTFGADSERAAQQDPLNGEGPVGNLFELPAGNLEYDLPDGQIEVSTWLGGYLTPSGLSQDFSQLPLEPGELLAEIYRFTDGQGPSRDGEALVWIADTLRYGAVPAEYRAAMYKAAALIPGVYITDDQATLDGTTGIAIGRDETNNAFRQEIILEPATGQFIGERLVALEGFGATDIDAGLPAGTVVGWTAVTTEIVDAAPTDVSVCGT